MFDLVCNIMGLHEAAYKYMDLIISTARFDTPKGAVRRIVDVTEALKEWDKEPEYVDLFSDDRRNDLLKPVNLFRGDKGLINSLSSHDLSIDAPLRDEEGPSAADVLPTAEPSAEEQVARQQLQEQAEEAIARFREDLNERDRTLLNERILSESPRTLQAIGERFGITREAVRQAEARLMKRLSEFLRGELGEH